MPKITTITPFALFAERLHISNNAKNKGIDINILIIN